MASSVCLPINDRVFGPRVETPCRAFDFTLLFEDIFFECLPTAVFFLLLPFHLIVLNKAPVLCSLRSKLLLGKLATLIGIFISQLVLLILRSRNTVVQTSASLAADTLAIVGTVGIAWLSCIDHQRSLRPSTLLGLYLSALVILDIPRVRTLWLIGNANEEAAVLTASLGLKVVTLLLESTEKKSSAVGEKILCAPEEYCGVWNRTAFTWLSTTFRIGYSKILAPNDLPILDTRLQSSVLRQNLVKTWAKYDHRARHSLLRASFHANILSFLSAIPPRLCKSVFILAQPLLINITVSYVGEATADISFGRGLIGAWALVFLGIACSTALSTYQVSRFVTRVKGGLIGLIYQETMNARTLDLGETTPVALMGTDVERIAFNFLQIHEAWASIIEIAVAIWLLEQQVFLACLAPVFVILISIGVNGPISHHAKNAQLAWIEKVQARLRITSSMLDDMKAIKMLGLSALVAEMIEKLRYLEIQTSKAYRKLLVWNVLLSECPKNIAPLVTFAVNLIIALYWKKGSLLTAQAFTSIALINLLTNPVIQLIQIMPQLLQCVTSFERIQAYCNRREDEPSPPESNEITLPPLFTGSSVSLHPLPQTMSDLNENCQEHNITLEKASFTWEHSRTPFLKDIELKIPKGSITAIIGVVGSGKSMLLESILGETICSLGTVSKCASVAYCSQQPWLENGTIQSNIIGVSQHDAKWYNTVNKSCGLEADLKALEGGDKTVVGSKGLNLSGGQKHRIALARAVYSRKELLLLDDVFSGMDAHTVDLVSRRLLGNGGLLRKRGTTVVLATHSQKLMSSADTIVALEAGRIVQTGIPQDFLIHKAYFDNHGLHLQDQDPIETIARVESVVPESFHSEPHIIEEIHDKSEMWRKNGDWSVYSYYFASSSYEIVIMFLLSMAVWVFCTEFATVWLKWWSEANKTEPNKDAGFYVGIYAFLSIFGVVAVAVSCWIGIVKIISNSALSLHSALLASTGSFAVLFFYRHGYSDEQIQDANAEIIDSQDMELIDMNLPIVMINYVSTALSVIAKAIIIVVFSQYLATMAPFVVALLYVLQSFYLQTSRQVRLLEIEAKAPIYTHFIESVGGAATIRAFGWKSQYQERNYGFIDQAQRPAYLQYCIQSWLGFVLDIVVTIIAVVLVAVVVTWKNKFSAGNVGVSLVMVMSFSSDLMRMIKTWTMMESSIGAVARIKRFVAETESEERSGCTTKVAENWPAEGNVDFKGLVAAHSSNAEPVLRGISFSIKQSEHIALCGRSGSGKTSTILALLQMIETRGGQTTIDGVDISTMSCTDVRSRLNVVPQDPLLMPGTIRLNIDPFGKASDENIIRALERIQLWGIISEKGGLGKEIDTSMWSVGQKQLLCLARAMVRNSKVLILDEAMSSVDSETEALMQDIIDTTFKECTVIAVMHRLAHVAQYDKVALLDNGHLMEFDTPKTLLGQNSRFASLYLTGAA